MSNLAEIEIDMSETSEDIAPKSRKILQTLGHFSYEAFSLRNESLDTRIVN